MSTEKLKYDPETGYFIRYGRRAGSPDCTKGYRRIMWNGERHKEHRLAWFFYYGIWPTNQIDHINGIKDDNRIINLRDVSQTINMYNKTQPHKHNTTGFLGVSKSSKKYTSRIRVRDKLIYLGTFHSAQQAHEVYLQFKEKLIAKSL